MTKDLERTTRDKVIFPDELEIGHHRFKLRWYWRKAEGWRVRLFEVETVWDEVQGYTELIWAVIRDRYGA